MLNATIDRFSNSLFRKPFYRIQEITREHIRSFVSKNDLNNAADILIQLVGIFSPDKINEVVIIQRGISANEEAYRLNICDMEQISRERNRLGLAILDLSDFVCNLP